MTGKFWIINSEAKLDNLLKEIKSEWELYHWLKVQITTGKVRSAKQQAAIEVYCRLIAEAFNESGLTFEMFFKPGHHIDWSQEIVKNEIWKPIQKAVLGKESTTELERPEVSEIYDHVNRKLSEHGYYVPFPDKDYKNESN